LRLLAAGTLLGAAGAWLAGRGMQAVLFGVSGSGAVILAAALGLMTIVTLAACVLPSRRAARIAPMEALGDC
jgi:ABC-type antimicrobial peptide transport system permease subunit